MSSIYRNYLEGRSALEIHNIAHSKRFLERYMGDGEFRSQLDSEAISLNQAARQIGVEIEIDSLRPVYDKSFSRFRRDATEGDWPLTALWNDYIATMFATRDEQLERSHTNGKSASFDKWRERQIGRCRVELGPNGNGIVHPIISFELSEGCSVGCWFCGVSAKPFGGHATLQNGGRAYWTDILLETQEIVGDALRSGFCYWATDPLDNPEYADFLEILQSVSGVVPQTTSAIPLRNLDLTRRVLEVANQHCDVPSRFSVLTANILRKIHAEFTPQELLKVELVLQGEGSLSAKSFAGRARSKATSPGKISNLIPGATIACVTGFLVNILTKKIQLISPTIPSTETPNGYYVFDERKFDTPSEYGNAIRSMIKENMSHEAFMASELKLNTKSEFRFDRISPAIETPHFIFDSPLFSELQPIIADSSVTMSGLMKKACENGADIFKTVSVFEGLLSSGLVDRKYDIAAK